MKKNTIGWFAIGIGVSIFFGDIGLTFAQTVSASLKVSLTLLAFIFLAVGVWLVRK